MALVTAATMLPDPEALTEFQPTERLAANARPAPPWRDELRRIPNLRNAFGVFFLYAQTIGIIVAAVWIDNWLVWALAFVLMGRAHAQFAALMHEAAHRHAVPQPARQRLGRPLAARLPVVHADRPVPPRPHGASPRRVRPRRARHPAVPRLPHRPGVAAPQAHSRRRPAAPGSSSSRDCCAACDRPEPAVRSQARRIVAVQLVLIAIGIALHHPWVYFILWLAPYLTVWRVINRLRSIAEHGGMERSKDRRLTTHSVRQSFLGPLLPRAVPHRLAPRPPRRLRACRWPTSRSCTPSCGGPAT